MYRRPPRLTEAPSPVVSRGSSPSNSHGVGGAASVISLSAVNRVDVSLDLKLFRVGGFSAGHFFLLDVQEILSRGATNQETVQALYELDVFRRNKARQNLANVVQYTLMQLVRLISQYNLSGSRELFNSLWDVVEGNIAALATNSEHSARCLSTIVYNLGLLS